MSIEEKRLADMSYNELTSKLNTCEDNSSEKVKVMDAMRAYLRRESMAIKDTLDKDKEDTIKQKKLLKETHTNLLASRKEYLETYRNMNKIMSGMSMLKHLEEFKKCNEGFNAASALFSKCLKDHIANLEKVKAMNDDL